MSSCFGFSKFTDEVIMNSEFRELVKAVVCSIVMGYLHDVHEMDTNRADHVRLSA